MAISASGYLNHLQNYLNIPTYGKTCLAEECKNIKPNQIILSEKIEGTGIRRKVLLEFSGEAFAVRLDQGKNPLFHFLKTQGHPWGRRCDFVIFHAVNNSLKVYCIEFKEASTRIPLDKAHLQLKSAEAWCKSLNKIVSAYIGDTKTLNLTKYLFTACKDPSPDLGVNNQYLSRYPSIRHYLFDEVDGQNLSFLNNSTVTTIR